MKSFDDDDENSDLKPKVPFLVYFKGFFLLSMIIAGMMILNEMSKVDKARSRGFSQTIENLKKNNTDSQKVITSLQDKYIGTEASSIFASAKDKVLGEATQLKNQTISKTEEVVVDYIYDNTLVVAIENLINKLPTRQKEKLRENMCK